MPNRIKTAIIDKDQLSIDDLKVQLDELGQALNRASEEIFKCNQNRKIDHLLDYISKYKQIFLPSSTGYKSVNTREICFIRKDMQSGKVEVVFDQDDSLVLPANYSLLQLIDVLPKNDFFQVKRELIINLRYLSEVEIFNKICIIKKGDYTMKLSMSRRSLKEFKDRMVI